MSFNISAPITFYAIDQRNRFTYYVGAIDKEWRYLPANIWKARTGAKPQNPQNLLKIDDQCRTLINRIYHQNYRLTVQHDITNVAGEVTHWRVFIALPSGKQVERFIVRKDALLNAVWKGLYEYGAGDKFTVTADSVVLSRPTGQSDPCLVDNCVIKCGSDYVVGLGPHKMLKTSSGVQWNRYLGCLR